MHVRTACMFPTAGFVHTMHVSSKYQRPVITQGPSRWQPSKRMSSHIMCLLPPAGTAEHGAMNVGQLAVRMGYSLRAALAGPSVRAASTNAAPPKATSAAAHGEEPNELIRIENRVDQATQMQYSVCEKAAKSVAYRLCCVVEALSVHWQRCRTILVMHDDEANVSPRSAPVVPWCHPSLNLQSMQ